ncbi:hypothetical protein TREES_T100018658 [Tupaia chinensis]|uniref:Uncharacterized protein n=1 Tax=Tupaia chinensis TaxID=246437 RepID=L9KMW9_TUPCH|nr:hypothetical protein TREES_T100018658 [Tupaia chinensis]
MGNLNCCSRAPVEDITEELSCEDFLEEEIPSSVKLSTKSLVLRSRDSTEDIKGDEEQEGEMKTNTTGESTEVAAPVPDHTNEDEETEETPTNFVTDIWEGISPWTSEFLEFSKYWET